MFVLDGKWPLNSNNLLNAMLRLIAAAVCGIKYAFGRAALWLGRTNASVAWFVSVTEMCPNHTNAQRHLAWALAAVGRYEEAVKHYRQLVVKLPTSAHVLFGLADALQKLDRHAEAIIAFYAAIDLDHDDPLIQYNLAASLVACGRLQDALVVYRRVARLLPEYAPAIGSLGAMLGELRHWEDALECHQKAMALEPNAVHGHNLGVTLAELGRLSEAEHAFREALHLEPNSAELEIRLSMVLAQQQKHPEALQVLESLVKVEPTNVVALASLSTVLVLAGRCDDAIRIAKQAVSLRPTDSVPHAALGWAYIKQGEGCEALNSYDEAVARDPSNVEWHAGRAAALSLCGRHSEAVEAFEAVMAEDPGFLQRYEEFVTYRSASTEASNRR